MLETAVISSLISTVGIIAVSVITLQKDRNTIKANVTSSPYEVMATRVVSLEDMNETAMREQYIDRSYIMVLISAWPAGVPLPEPRPAWLVAKQGA